MDAFTVARWEWLMTVGNQFSALNKVISSNWHYLSKIKRNVVEAYDDGNGSLVGEFCARCTVASVARARLSLSFCLHQDQLPRLLCCACHNPSSTTTLGKKVNRNGLKYILCLSWTSLPTGSLHHRCLNPHVEGLEQTAIVNHDKSCYKKTKHKKTSDQ